MNEDLKKCCTCHELKEKSEFYLKIYNNGRYKCLTKDCKECIRKRSREWYKRNSRKRCKQARDHSKKKYLEARNILGDKCRICNNDKRIIFHEIYGTPHRRHPYIYLKEPDRFRPLCSYCHGNVHLFMDKYNKTWKNICDFLDIKY